MLESVSVFTVFSLNSLTTWAASTSLNHRVVCGLGVGVSLLLMAMVAVELLVLMVVVLLVVVVVVMVVIVGGGMGEVVVMNQSTLSKNQIINILGFVDHMASVTIT